MLKVIDAPRARPLSARIATVDTAIVDLPFRRLQRFARLDARSQNSLLVRIRTRDGLEGIGEAIVPCGPWWSGDSVEAMKLTIDTYLAPSLIGEDPHDVAAIFVRLGRSVRNNAFAKAGLEIALLDLIGKLHDLPVHVLLGGRSRSACPVAWPLASGSTEKDIEEIDEMLGSGRAAAFKVKMGATGMAADLTRIGRLAETLKGRAGLRVDPNESWTEADALRALPALAEMGVEMVEQPVERALLDGMARITARSNVTIMIDEGAQSEADMIEVVKRNAAHMVSIKPMKAGGLWPAKRMADIAAAAGIPVYMGTFLESSIGTAAGMQLAATFDRLPLGGEIIGPLLLAEDIVTEPLIYADGALQLPEGPGLGVTLDEDKLRAFTRH
ncbi:muconate cycloisomerase family protein [Algihabitans albus]|uniref:muconate cycloisomerase family protein n=1 Tax=Algihabitans albus TaxID=2164067 RepID=UPI000E5DA2F0|nr:muconate cycloisomerase family protein [Algihabitans albus]